MPRNQDLLQQVFDGGDQPLLPSRPIPNIYAPEPSRTPAFDEFFETARNPPVRQRPSALRMVGTGLLSALQGSTGPESRVPLYNERGKVVGSRESGFLESLGNQPFNVPQAKSILDIPHEARVEDWERGAKGLQQAAVIESQMERSRGLPEQRYAQAAAIPQRVIQGQQKVDIAQQEADRRTYLASLNTLTDAEKINLLQEGKIELQDIRDAAALGRVNVQQAGATQRTGMQQTGATERTGMQQTGANTRNQANIAAAMERVKAQQAGATERTAAGIAAGSKSATLPSQQKTQQLLRANEVLNQHPEWDDFIDVDPNTGMVQIAPAGTGKSWWSGEGGLDEATRSQIYNSIYGTAPPSTQQTTNPITTPPAKTPTKPPVNAGVSVEMTTPDGKGTRMVPADQVELAKRQGFTPKRK